MRSMSTATITRLDMDKNRRNRRAPKPVSRVDGAGVPRLPVARVCLATAGGQAAHLRAGMADTRGIQSRAGWDDRRRRTVRLRPPAVDPSRLSHLRQTASPVARRVGARALDFHRAAVAAPAIAAPPT